MGEFKKGDFVRVKDNRGAPMDYEKGDVCQVSAVRDDLVFSNKKPGMFAKRFEPWQPRIGERVRYRNATHGEAIVKETLPDGRFVVDTQGRYGICTERLRSLEPILTTTTPEQPATLKIEAGRFYKTGDGSKVGPMESCPTGGWQSGEKFSTGLWLDDGQPKYSMAKDSPALIAEWVDEPVAKANTTKAINDNAQPKFKVGDRISGYAPAFGVVTGIVTAFDNSSPTQTYMIRDDKSGYTVWVENYSLELVTQPTTNAIVALIENGQPKPSSTPHVHISTGAAENEAKRLAAKYKGKQFGVFTLTTTHEEESQVYDHKWQNMAALGLKIDAIKELRAVAGLDLLSAKRAVEAFSAAA